MGLCSGCEQQRDCLVSSGMVPSGFVGGTNLIKQGEIITGRPCGPMAQWSEYWHGLRGVLGLCQSGYVFFLFPPL